MIHSAVTNSLSCNDNKLYQLLKLISNQRKWRATNRFRRTQPSFQMGWVDPHPKQCQVGFYPSIIIGVCSF
ncbi:hypothetical protein HZ326_2533 [Fusarium oxysporum f. sp. albedinis]|nr:hypothetical protein HZ326_2533 [Fusarium oxysporum f. sp. albedinis]